MRKIALVVGATLGISGTALAASTVYEPGVYAGDTTQTTAASPNIAMKVAPGVMKKMVFEDNLRCYSKSGAFKGYLKNHKATLGSATITNQQVNTVYNSSTESVHLQVALNHGNAGGNFKDAYLYDHNGNILNCVSPGGQATAAGKIFFHMHVQ